MSDHFRPIRADQWTVEPFIPARYGSLVGFVGLCKWNHWFEPG